MKILVTGSRGFVGRNLVSQLHNIRDGKARNYGIAGEELTIYEYDMDSDPAELDVYCRQADFVFNLAGVNRPQDASEFMKYIEEVRQYLSGNDFLFHAGRTRQPLR